MKIRFIIGRFRKSDSKVSFLQYKFLNIIEFEAGYKDYIKKTGFAFFYFIMKMLKDELCK